MILSLAFAILKSPSDVGIVTFWLDFFNRGFLGCSIAIRRAMAGLVGLIARLTLPVGEWPEFWPAMFALANSEHIEHRTSLLEVLTEIGDKIFDFLVPQMVDLIAFCGVCMAADQPPEMRVKAMDTFGVLAGEVQESSDELVPVMQPLVMAALEVIDMCVKAGADYEARGGLNTFQAMIRLCPSIIAPHVLDITQFCLITVANHEIDWEVRMECLGFIEDVIKFRPSYLSKHGLLDPVISVIFDVAAEPEPETNPWSSTPHKFAITVLSTISQSVKPKYVFEGVMARVDAWMGSENPWQRRAAVGAIAAIPNGCIEEILPVLENFLPYLQASFEDPDPLVRRAGCSMLHQFSETLSPDFTEHHEVCLPLVFKALNEGDEELQQYALYALVTFLGNIEGDVIVDQLLDDLVRRLVQILETSHSKDLQEIAMNGIATVASSVGDKFIPYFEPVVLILDQLMSITQPELLALRAQALQGAGMIAVAVGKQTFGPWFNHFMEKALESLQFEGRQGTELRECSITFFGDVAEALGEDFLPYLETVMGILFETLSNTDGIKPELGDENRAMAGLMAAAMSDDEEGDTALPQADQDDEDVDEEDRLPEELEGLKYITNRGLIQEKTDAIQTLGVIAIAVGAAFMPYLERSIELFETLARYVHPKVRTIVAFGLESCATVLNAAYPPAAVYVTGSGEDPAAFPLHPEVQNFINTLIETFCKRIRTDIDLAVVCRNIQALSTFVKNFGPPSVHDAIATAIGPAIALALNSDTVSHRMAEEEGDDENEMIYQESLAVFDACCDFIIDVARGYGPAFGQWFSLLEGILLHAAAADDQEPTDPADDPNTVWRQQAVGCLSETADAATMAAFDDKQVQILLARAMKGLKDPAITIRTNSIYLVRSVVTSPSSFDWYPIILPILIPFLLDEDDQTADNSNGAIANMIATNPAGLPMDEVITEWLSGFPIRCDQIEAGISFGVLLNLLENANQHIFPHIPVAFRILIDAIGSEVVEEDLRLGKITDVTRSLWAQFSAELTPVLDELEEDSLHNVKLILGLDQAQ